MSTAPVSPRIALVPGFESFPKRPDQVRTMTATVHCSGSHHHAMSAAYQLAALIEKAMAEVPDALKQGWLLSVYSSGHPMVTLDLYYVKGPTRPTPEMVQAAERLVYDAMTQTGYSIVEDETEAENAVA